MSLVIITVDRENRTHTIFSDGIEVSNDYMDVISQQKNKTRKLECCGHSVLFGFCGDSNIGRYMSNHIGEYLEEFRIFEKMNSHVDEVEELFIRMFQKVYDTYKEDMRHEEDDITFQCVLSIDGQLFRIEKSDEPEIDSKVINDSDFTCIGIGSDIASALIENNVAMNNIFNTIHKHKTCIGSEMFILSDNF